MKLRIVTSGTLLVAVSVVAQRSELVEELVRDKAVFDTLPAWYDRSEISVDTTVVVADSLWMAVMWMSDADSMRDEIGEWYRSGGVCEFVFLMTLNPVSARVLDYRQIRTECDIDQSNPDVVYYSHRIREPGIVEVISSKPRRWRESESEWEELVPFELNWFKVLPNGDIKDMGPGVFTGGLPR